MRNQKGITLVALIITIIILLIISGAAIVALIGDNRIITKSRKCKKYNRKSNRERKDTSGSNWKL